MVSAAADDPLGAAVALLFVQGWRVSEVLGLAWDDRSTIRWNQEVGNNATNVRTPLKTVGASLYSDPMGFIFTPGSDLVAPFNAGLAAMKSDGTLDAMITRWFFEYGK